MNWIVGILQIVFGLLFSKNKSERLGRAEKELEIRKSDDDRINAAVAAANSVASDVVRNRSKLRDKDKYSRD